jgi:hypothetical protein
VSDFGGGFHVVHDAEEIRRLHDDGGGEIVNLTVQVFEVDGSGLGQVAEFLDRLPGAASTGFPREESAQIWSWRRDLNPRTL